jgi:uncharacterized membrane protein YphA (DoxX/SURF4 family)
MAEQQAVSAHRPARERLPIRILVWILGIGFLFIGGLKLAGNPAQVELFRVWGYPSWFLYVVGGTEIMAGLLLMMPLTRLLGGILLLCTMSGAAVTHIRADELDRIFPALLGWAAAAIVTWAYRPGAD